MSSCVFCKIVRGEAPAKIVREWDDAMAFVPLDPVVPDVPDGHVLVIPHEHVDDAGVDPRVSGLTMVRASELAGELDAMNIITSKGEAATQSVKHLHLHVVLRRDGDGLKLPWWDQQQAKKLGQPWP
ncbi:MAG: HIT domain-containing protein [Actinoplanes sp.]